MSIKVDVKSTRDDFGLIVYVFTFPDGKIYRLTKTQIELLKEEIAEYDEERRKK